MEALKEEALKIKKRIEEIRNQPRTRMSAVGGVMLLEARLIEEWCNLDKRLGEIEAEILKVSNNEGEKLWFTAWSNIVSISKSVNGVLTEGGILPNYFVGRPNSEYISYVKVRHRKSIFEIEISDSEINISENVATMNVRVGERTFRVETEFKIPVKEKAHFYIEFSRFSAKNVKEERGANEKERLCCKYAVGYIYQQLFAPGCYIQIR